MQNDLFQRYEMVSTACKDIHEIESFREAL